MAKLRLPIHRRQPATRSVSSPYPKKKRSWLPTSHRARQGILLILALMLLFLLLLFNQARIARKGFNNASREAQIRYQIKQNAQRREEYLKSADLARIREEAIRLGMSPPVGDQIVEVSVDRQNYIEIGDPKRGGLASSKEDVQELARREEVELRRALENVASYIQGEAGAGRTETIREQDLLSAESEQPSNPEAIQEAEVTSATDEQSPTGDQTP